MKLLHRLTNQAELVFKTCAYILYTMLYTPAAYVNDAGNVSDAN